MKLFTSKIFVLLGFVLILTSIYDAYLFFLPANLSFDHAPIVTNTNKPTRPLRVEINAVGINVPVKSSVINNNTWETTNSAVSFLKTSAIPGEKGNSIFYGHNKKKILGNLSSVVPGNIINIYMSDGSKQEFVVEFTDIVKPSMTSIINNTPDTRITIYTCTGFFDIRRFVVVAKPINNFKKPAHG